MGYGTDEAMATYWASKGYDVAGITPAVLREIASAFVDGLGWRMAGKVAVPRFPGIPTAAGQEREWPRTGATDIYGRALDASTVPGAVERATYEAAFYEAVNPGALNEAVRSDERVVREKFGPVEFQYAEPGATKGAGLAESSPVIPAVMAILAPIMAGGSNPYGITGIVA